MFFPLSFIDKYYIIYSVCLSNINKKQKQTIDFLGLKFYTIFWSDNMKKILAFDIDGTLTDRQTNIQQGVKNIFLDNRLKNYIVLFVTGNTITTVGKVRENLKKLAGKTISVNSYCATLGGSIIYDDNGNKILERFLCRKRIKNFFNTATKIDPDCVFLFMHNDHQTFNHITSEKIKSIVDKNLKNLNMALDEIVFDNEDYHTLLPKLDRIYSVNIFSLNHAKDIMEALSPLAQDAGYPIYISKHEYMVQIAANSKLKALKYMVAKLKKDKVFEGDLGDVVYFGDGGNDVECLKACGLSVARGSNLDKAVVDASNIYAEDITPHLDMILK